MLIVQYTVCMYVYVCMCVCGRRLRKYAYFVRMQTSIDFYNIVEHLFSDIINFE